MAETKSVDFSKYMLPTTSEIASSRQPSLSSQQSNEYSMRMMPLVRFRDYVCEGLGRRDDEKVA